MTYRIKIVVAVALFSNLINTMCAQQEIWEEIYRDEQDVSSDGFSFGGFVGLCLLIAIIWIISKAVKVIKEERVRKMEQRKQNEKRTDDILSNIDGFINTLNENKEE